MAKQMLAVLILLGTSMLWLERDLQSYTYSRLRSPSNIETQSRASTISSSTQLLLQATFDDKNAPKDYSSSRPIKVTATFKKKRTNTNNATQSLNQNHSDYLWWTPYVDQIARAFQPSHDTAWCIRQPWSEMHQKHNKKRPRFGLWFIRVPKTGSSTAAGISLQIAENLEQRLSSSVISNNAQKASSTTDSNISTGPCNLHYNHGNAYVGRKGPHFTWTILRDPTARAISWFFFSKVSRRGKEPTEQNMIPEYKRQKNFQLKYIGGWHDVLGETDHPFEDAINHTKVVELVQNTLQKYNYVALVERMEECLVVMKLLFSFLEYEDIIFLSSSKQAGGFDDGLRDGNCYKIQKSFTTPAVDQYLAENFPRDNYDFFLYAVLNRSLDLTIEQLGRSRVDKEIEKYRELRGVADEQCHNKTIFPCVAEGKARNETSCYKGDLGCGHVCIKETIQEYVYRTTMP